MGIIRKVLLLFMLTSTLFLPIACSNNFQTSNLSLCEVKLSKARAHSSAAYFLSEDGTLYCTGADSDTSSYAVYQDAKRGIVAENVCSFGELPGGGYYIDKDQNLYIWNKQSLPLYKYNDKTKLMQVLENVVFAVAESNYLLYADNSATLYLVGTFNGETYGIDSPKLLAEDVVCADVNDEMILWAKDDGSIDSYGQVTSTMMAELNAQFMGTCVTEVHMEEAFVVVLSNNDLWYYGDYQKLVSGNESKINGLMQLGSGMSNVSSSRKTIAALDNKANVWLWGKCVSNDSQNTDVPEFTYCEKFCLAENATDVFVSDSSICFVDKNGGSNCFYSTGWPEFYGNSTKDPCVGINRESSTWVK
ncbi:MAG: hypothetical protein IJC17_04720 [Clostridia bacterium]|nr:hypothetical protein [Clostridia bacterium]